MILKTQKQQRISLKESLILEKINKTEKLLPRLMKKKGEMTHFQYQHVQTGLSY